MRVVDKIQPSDIFILNQLFVGKSVVIFAEELVIVLLINKEFDR